MLSMLLFIASRVNSTLATVPGLFYNVFENIGTAVYRQVAPRSRNTCEIEISMNTVSSSSNASMLLKMVSFERRSFRMLSSSKGRRCTRIRQDFLDMARDTNLLGAVYRLLFLFFLRRCLLSVALSCTSTECQTHSSCHSSTK